jgi:DNA-binding beta-propeller fold protein YncE
VGGGAFAVAVDQASNTIYVPSSNDGTVSVINGAACNARVTSGCRRTPPAVTTGAGPQFVAVGHWVHTAFTINHFDDTLSAINTRTCQGSVTSGCRKRPPNQQATPDHGPGFNSFPTFFALVPGTGSAYVVNVGGRNILSVTSTSRCNAADTTRCADHPATVTVGRFPGTPVLNTATQTMYVPFGSMANRVAVVNTATCNATDTTGCGQAPAVATVGKGTSNLAVSATTNTIYAANSGLMNFNGDTVSVINGATCDGTNHSGCGHLAATAKVGRGPARPESP